MLLSLSTAGWLRRLAQELLLAGVAEDVRVGVAVADVGQRVRADQALVAGLDVDRREPGALRVVVVAVDVDVDAADVVDRALEAVEVDVDDAVDRHLAADRVREQQLDRVQGERRAALVVGLVDLGVVGVTGDRHREVTRQRHHRDPVALRVQPDEHDRVRVRLLGLAVELRVGRRLGAPVGAEHEQRPRTARLDLGELLLRDLDRRRGGRGALGHLRAAGSGDIPRRPRPRSSP